MALEENDILVDTLSGNSISATTFYLGSSNLNTIFAPNVSGGYLPISGGTVTGATNINNTFNVTGATTMAALTTTGATIHNNTLNVTGATTLASLIANGITTINNTLNVTGSTTLASLTASGATIINNTLNVNGATAISPLASSGAPISAFVVNTAAHTLLSASTEFTDIFLHGVTQQFSGGTINVQRFMRLGIPIYSFLSASTANTVSTFSITNSPQTGTNATFINSYALWVQAGETCLSGSVRLNYVVKSATYSILPSDYTVEVTGGTFTMTLPDATTCRGRVYVLKNSGTGFITLATTSSQTIDQFASAALKFGQYVCYNLQSNGANWIII